MRSKIISLGQTKSVLFISVASIIISIFTYTIVGYSLEDEVNTTGIVVSIVVPSIIAPSVSWYMVGMFIKVHHLEVKMRMSATYDSLTNVMSRKAFMSNLYAMYDQIKENHLNLSLLYIDIDNFKDINDIYGHSGGDRVLEEFGEVLNNYKKTNNLIGRLGGEEFVFALSDIDINDAKIFANNLKNEIEQKVTIYNNNEIRYTISIGISTLNNQNIVTIEEMIRQSDDALYKAKSTGRNRVVLYSY